MKSFRNKPEPHPLLWVVESLQEEPGYLDRSWFGCRAVYFNGLMVLVLCSGEEPWNGLLIPTTREFHDSISKDHPGVFQHPVLKKWLYLPEASEDFESVAIDLIEKIRLGDQRIGIEPGVRPERKRRSSTRALRSRGPSGN